MITCTLRDKKYHIDFVSGRALRELEPAAQMYAKVVHLSELAAKGQSIPEDAKFTISEAMDTMIRWFCILFQNQFTPDDVLDNYPVDRLIFSPAEIDAPAAGRFPVSEGAGSSQQKAGELQYPTGQTDGILGKGPAETCRSQKAGRRGHQAIRAVLPRAGRVRFCDHCRQGEYGRAGAVV